MATRFLKRVVSLLTILLVSRAYAQNLTSDEIANVTARLAEAALESWELGTRAEALLELTTPSLSVFSQNSLPPSPAITSESLADSLSPVFNIATTIVGNRSVSNNNATGPQPLISDASAADPASIGVAVLLANWTGNCGGCAGAARDQLNYLLEVVPRTGDGAISHRVSQVQLWSDFVYMVPPFLAYYAILSQNKTLLTESYNQIKLYRSYLMDTDAGGMWKHVLLGEGMDNGHWSTGNGWAAAGMLRVLATIKSSQYANTMKSEQKDLKAWIKEIHTGIYPHMDNTSIFTNYADVSLNTSGNFYDAASTTLLASTVYRTSVLNNDHSHIPFAEKSRLALFASGDTFVDSFAESSSAKSSTSSRSSTSTSERSDSSSTATSTETSASSTATSPAPSSGLVHFTSEGYLTPVVNPHLYGLEGSKSAEGQAFVLELQAAWSDWVDKGSKGTSGARGRGSEVVGVMWMWVVLGVVGVGLLDIL